MTTAERIGYLIIGCFIGFVLGYIVRSLREIKEDVHRDMRNKEPREKGAITTELLTRIALLIVVVLTAYSAFKSQQASNRVQDTQKSQIQVTECNKKFLEKTITALNARTTYTKQQIDANVKLQQDQATFITLFLRKTQPSQAVTIIAFRKYAESLTNFVSSAKSSSNNAAQFPFPTNSELQACLKSK